MDGLLHVRSTPEDCVIWHDLALREIQGVLQLVASIYSHRFSVSFVYILLSSSSEHRMKSVVVSMGCLPDASGQALV